MAQVIAANVLPASTGYDLGSTTQRWDLYSQNVDVSGSITGDLRTFNNIAIADLYTGDDWGAKAAAAFAAGAGEVWITTDAGTTAPAGDLAIPAGKTLRFMQGGTFALGTRSITLSDGSRLIGPGPSSLTITSTKTSGNVFVPANTAAQTLKCRLEGFHLQGTSGSSGGTGISMENARQWYLAHLKVSLFRVAGDTGAGIYMLASAANCNANTLVDVHIDSCDYGLVMDASNATYICGYNKCFGLYVDGELIGIDLRKTTSNGAGYNEFYGFHVQGSSTAALKVAGSNNRFHGTIEATGAGAGALTVASGASANLFDLPGLTFAAITDSGTNSAFLAPAYQRLNATNFYTTNGNNNDLTVTWEAGLSAYQAIVERLRNKDGIMWTRSMSASATPSLSWTRQGGLTRLQFTTSNCLLNAESTGTVDVNVTASSGTGGTRFGDGAGNSVASVSSTGLGAFNGGLKAGSAGTTITQTKVYTPSLTPASVAANSVAVQDFTVSGLTTSDTVVSFNHPSVTAGVAATSCRGKAADTLEVAFVNATAGALTPAAGVYRILALRS